ncbi:hypothetical protein BSR29_03020 [Boudabousia liubingyangii]|uniref:DUF3168 domain-containing protein n=4 Tax=Boudabousia TaxID=2767318 RepID=A0A1D9MLP5_9ACTO|nr:hypothetical protein [Boudabousia liubingyangii]AOZ73083.1 hypothetical protein BK816_07095 [Boudabousia tangfeifanii]OKL47010.1 hypothetical protein BSR28_06220 [Boudabousia liubingyangii]OKL48843.1 hypothetical protein BSR29_03020 [Boudabousia liubingyangii]
MECLELLMRLFNGLGMPVFTGSFPPQQVGNYIVLTPLADVYDLHADNAPGVEIQYVRVNIFTTGSYKLHATNIPPMLRNAGLTITERRYIGHDPEAGYHHYVIEVALAVDPH